ncbi:hypothetical protein [Corynebacterium marquesiae]|uniref:hypothetical protein n=1 Tax=Corynebacterium marquesiae TaxID=2913503 RepID=UPI0038D1B390
MTNFVHALAVLEAARRPGEIRIHPHDAVEALAKAGLIMPDLPEPDRAVDSDEAEWYLPGQISVIARIADRIEVFGLTPNRQRFHLSLTDMEAEAAAHTLLAAANYSEEE